MRLTAWVILAMASCASGAQEELPSMEMLLYLADWEVDRNGQLVDPMDVPQQVDAVRVPQSRSGWKVIEDE